MWRFSQNVKTSSRENECFHASYEFLLKIRGAVECGKITCILFLLILNRTDSNT